MAGGVIHTRIVGTRIFFGGFILFAKMAIKARLAVAFVAFRLKITNIVTLIQQIIDFCIDKMRKLVIIETY